MAAPVKHARVRTATTERRDKYAHAHPAIRLSLVSPNLTCNLQSFADMTSDMYQHAAY